MKNKCVFSVEKVSNENNSYRKAFVDAFIDKIYELIEATFRVFYFERFMRIRCNAQILRPR